MVTKGLTRSHKKIAMAITLILFTSTLLQGCLYPKEMRKENQASAKDGILLVQHAVDEYQQASGILPLINADMNTPRYEKFKVDFSALTSSQLLSSIPTNAFENGGHDIYLILDEETEPLVRVMDLVTAQHVNDLQRLVNRAVKDTGQVPLGAERYPGFYDIPYTVIKAKDVEINSPFSGEVLSFMMDQEGNVYADYAADIMQAVQQAKETELVKQYDDLRVLLVEASYYSPAKSVVYKWQDNAPVPVANS